MQPVRISYESGDLTIAADRFGDPSASPVIFLHGLLAWLAKSPTGTVVQQTEIEP